MSKEKSPLVWLTKEILMPNQNLTEGSCPFITLNLLPTDRGQKQWCAHAIIDTSREKSIISAAWIASIIQSYINLGFDSEEIKKKVKLHPQTPECINSRQLTLSVFLKDTNEVLQDVDIEFVTHNHVQDNVIVLGNDFLCNGSQFHSMTPSKLIIKDPTHSSRLIRVPIKRYANIKGDKKEGTLLCSE